MSKINNPLMVISGCTGTGKSELGIAIARAFNGEVINCDSMQIYKGLNIATNKLTEQEMNGIPHHLIGFWDPRSPKFNVHSFKKQALAAIEDISGRGKLPILVGGTAYYIESVIYDNNLINLQKECSENFRENISEKFPTNEMLYEELKKIDPDYAMEVHKNNRFKILRGLEIFYLSGMRRSEFYALQKKHRDACYHFNSQLRYKNTFLINLDMDKKILDEQLNRRVEKMLQKGLLEELKQFHKQYKCSLHDHGILQSIGLKEFIPYLKLNEYEQCCEQGQEILRSCTDLLKLHTRQYAQVQRRWFYNRILLRENYREVPKAFALNVSENFEKKVIPYATKIVENYFSGFDFDHLLDNHLMMKLSPDEKDFNRPDYYEFFKKIIHCDICDLDLQGMKVWQIHVKGRRHRKTLLTMRKH